MFPRTVTSDPYACYFQYKVLNNVYYLNENLFSFDTSETSQCSFCNQNKETIEHLLSLLCCKSVMEWFKHFL